MDVVIRDRAENVLLIAEVVISNQQTAVTSSWDRGRPGRSPAGVADSPAMSAQREQGAQEDRVGKRNIKLRRSAGEGARGPSNSLETLRRLASKLIHCFNTTWRSWQDKMMDIIRSVLFAVLVVALLAMTGVTPITMGQGEHMDYLPFSKKLLRPFKLKRIELPEDLRSGRAINVAGVEIQEEKAAGVENEAEAESIHRLVFSGRNRSGKTWRVSAPALHYYEAFYEGDLDRNGMRDLILAMNTGGNGLAPSTRLIFLTFDRKGDPKLFAATGYYQSHPHGILDVADLDGDQRAELVHMVFDDGYWITNVYRVRESKWSRVTGPLAGLRFPLYTRFTNQPNHTPVQPARGRNPAAPNLLEPQPD